MIALAVYSLTDDPIFSPDKPNQTAAVDVVRTPQEELTSKPRPSAVFQSPVVQKESAATTEASLQLMSVASAVEIVTLPPNLTEAQG